ncbi:glycosyltransferase [Faecalimonas umbilicata]|uniref:glycosyltransferase n=1 Tax=Faecalimonas umbilicata TaxID=1912855 RepID=UPI0022DEAA4B|nr:glycosyltransferase [Faecalimonas umbilicata]
MSKKISVIMGIYNCANTLGEALNCIINQTYTNWEVIMCDDYSSDNTVQIAEKYVQKYPGKFVLLKNKKNHGLNYTLNKCLKVANGDYIARMDGDDLCALDRFEKEVSVLDKREDISIVSTDMNFFDEQGIWGRTNTEEEPTKESFLRATPFCHAACMVRKEAYQAVGGYSVSDKLLRVEDYHLWVKMYAKGYRGMNIQEPLYSMRDDRDAQGRRKFKYRLNEAYVKKIAINSLAMHRINYVYCLVPILKGVIPSFIYRIVHRKKAKY